MAFPRSRVTSQGQLSVPAEIRRKFGIGPGSVVEWRPEGDKIVLRRTGLYTSEDVHNALFKGQKPKPISVEQMKESIAKYVREKYARSRH